MTERIVITGAPGSGKTAFIELLRADRSFQQFLFFDELARQLLTERPEYRHRWSEFHREIYRRQTAREEANHGRSFVTDRGTVDAFAFHPETLDDVGTTLEREYERYTAVLQLGSTAGLGEAYYRTDDVRRESMSDALVIERALKSVWGGHRRYQFIEAQKLWETKYESCRKALDQLLHQSERLHRIS